MEYRVSIIGAGNIGCFYDGPESKQVSTHAHAVSISNGFALAGVYDIDKEKSRSAAKVWNVSRFEQIEDAINEADVLCICVPEMMHRAVYEKATEIGGLKAIVLEKPLAADKEDAIYITDQNVIPTFVNYSRRYLGAFVDLANWIQSRAGRFIVGNCYYGKGIVHNASHFVNLFDYLFGGVRLEQTGGVIKDYYDSDPSIEFALCASTGKIHFNVIPCNKVTVADFELFFEYGKIRYDGELEQIEYYDIQESNRFIGESNYVQTYCRDAQSSKAMLGLYQNVYEFLSGVTDIRCDILSAKRTFDICDEIRMRCAVL